MIIFFYHIFNGNFRIFFIQFLDPLEKQDSFEKELDDNGIIWDLDDHSHHSLIESRRFSPYGSEMKSPSNQGGVIDDSDSLDSIPVKDQSGESSEYHSAGLGEAGLNSLSINTYPPRKKQVNFQTLSEHIDRSSIVL